MKLNTSPRQQVDIDSDAMNEVDDCAVKAIAVAAGVTYIMAHTVCKLLGRVNGKGIHYFTILKALEKLTPIAYQYRQNELHAGGVNSLYVPSANNKSVKTLSRMAKSVGAKRLTFNQLPNVIRKDKNYIVMNWSHCAPVVNGEIQDWSAGSKMLVTELIELK